MCEHRSVTKTQNKEFDHPIQCDSCGLVFECEHEYELTDDYEPYCWVCDYEPDISEEYIKEEINERL